MQWSAAITSEAQMWSRNARETTGLDAMNAKARMTCKSTIGEDGSIDENPEVSNSKSRCCTGPEKKKEIKGERK